MPDFLDELKRRRVFRSAMLYLVAAWGAVEVSATILPLLGAPDWAPRAVLAVVAAGFPVAVVLAWRYDLGPGGIRETDAPAGRGVRIGQAALLAVAAVIGLALPTYIVVDVLSSDPQTRDEDDSLGPTRGAAVAILPFSNASADAEDAYFAHGITEEIVGALARFDGLHVLHPTAAERLLEAGATPDEVGRRLNAAYTLQGSVRRSSDVVRITTVLATTETREVVWQETYDPDLSVENLFDVQERVAGAVATHLNATLAPHYARLVGRAPTEDVTAFDLFLRANYDLSRRTPGTVTRAIAGFRAASDRDPDFAAAIAREAYGYELFVDWGWAYPSATAHDLGVRARDLAEQAIAVDSSSAEAWLALGYARYLLDATDAEGVLPALRRSLERNPADPESFHQYGQILMTFGHYSEAASAYHSALALDPTRAMTLVPLAAMSHRSRNILEARRWVDSAVAVGPAVPYAWSYRANLRNAQGDFAGAAEDARRSLEIDPSYAIPAHSALAVAEFRLGHPDEASTELGRALEALPDPSRPSATDALYLGGALVANSRIDEAIDLLARTPPSPWLWFSLQHPDFDPVRSDARFIAIESATDPRTGSGGEPQAQAPTR